MESPLWSHHPSAARTAETERHRAIQAREGTGNAENSRGVPRCQPSFSQVQEPAGSVSFFLIILN